MNNKTTAIINILYSTVYLYILTRIIKSDSFTTQPGLKYIRLFDIFVHNVTPNVVIRSLFCIPNTLNNSA